jgi:hypothetical protein
MAADSSRPCTLVRTSTQGLKKGGGEERERERERQGEREREREREREGGREGEGEGGSVAENDFEQVSWTCGG